MDDYAGKIVDLFSPDTATGLQFLTGAWVLTLSMFFLAAFVLPMKFVQDAVVQLGLPTWMYGVVLVLVVHAVVVLLRDDVLVHGDSSNKFVKAYQRAWPSTHIVEQFKVEQKVAECVWFSFMDKWEKPDDDRHGVWDRLNRRGYACRFVYHVQSVARALFWVSLVWIALAMLVASILERRAALPAGQALALVLFLGVWVGMRVINPVDPKASGGVWRRETQMNERMCRWIDTERAAVQAACDEQTKQMAKRSAGSFASEIDAG